MLSVRGAAAIAAGGYYARRLMRGRVPAYEAVAERSDVLSPPGMVDVVPFYYRADHLARIQDAPDFTAQHLIATWYRREQIEFYPLIVHRLRDAVLLGGSLYCGTRIRRLLRAGGARPRVGDVAPLVNAAAVEFEHAALVGGVAGSIWFGHWLSDEVPEHMLLEQAGEAIGHLRPAFRDEARYMQLLGLPAVGRVALARLREAAVVEEFAFNPSKAKRFMTMRQRISEKGSGRPGRVFLNRGNSGTARVIVNEASLGDRLAAEGFRIVDLAHCDLDTLLDELRGAELVISVEGSHLTHSLLTLAPEATIVCLAPPDRAYTTIADTAPFFGLHAATYVGRPAEQGFLVDPDDLLAFLDEASRHRRDTAPQRRRLWDEIERWPVSAP